MIYILQVIFAEAGTYHMKKLFVSSTFRDMQSERDSIQNHIIPELNMRLTDYGTKIMQTDLRWGISTSELSVEQGEQKVLNVCLEEISKARPYMIVMIGERYGWVPSSSIIEMTAKGRGISLESCDISVTQLEIEYIAFSEKWDESRVFFYFRDFDYGDMPFEQRAVYESESEESRAKLDKLKARIEKKFPRQIRRYSLKYEEGRVQGIDGFERLVSDDLFNLFLRDLQEDEKINVNERVRSKLHFEAQESFPVYVSNYDIYLNKASDIIGRDVTAIEKTHTYLAGPPRCGKSLSVLSRYMALYAYQNRTDPAWEIAEPMFDIHDSFYRADGIFSRLPSLIDINATFPLYLQLGNSKDIYTAADLWRTVLYFINKHLGVDGDIPEDKGELMAALIRGLFALIDKDKYFFLFVDDLSPEALADLFEIEHSFSKKQTPQLLKHFFFYVSFNNQFEQVPVYFPFFDHSEICVYNDRLNIPAEYFFAYARKLGKEMSPAVVNYINGYYGGYGKTYDDAELRHITRPIANLMSNYFMNFTSADYMKIKQAGNDMRAIEERNLALLKEVNGDLHGDLYGDTLKKLTLLNIEKFEANHSERTLRMLGTIYLLTGASFSMDEAKSIYSYLGEVWSDLDYISYFDDFKEFFVYNRDSDSYRVLPDFHPTLRSRFIERYFTDKRGIADSVERLIDAVQSFAFYERLRDELFYAILLVPDTVFVLNCLDRLKNADEFDFELGERLGLAVGEQLKIMSREEVRVLGSTLCPILSQRFSVDAICGFFGGIGGGFQDHEYERKVLDLAGAITPTDIGQDTERSASLMLAISLLRAYCYYGFKNDKVLEILCGSERWLRLSCRDMRIRYLALASALMRGFEEKSVVYGRLRSIVRSNLPPVEPLVFDSERSISVCADLYTLSFYVNHLSISEGFYDDKEILAWFLNKESFHRLGLYNIDTAIYAQNAAKIGIDELTALTTMMVESLSVHFPTGGYARRLVGNAFRVRMYRAAMLATDKEGMERTFANYFYPYRKAVVRSCDCSGYNYINYAAFLKDARILHLTMGVTLSRDETMWEATKMSDWMGFFKDCDEESLDVMLAVCWVFITYLRDPNFHDMISTQIIEEDKYCEYDAIEPSLRALHCRFVKTLCAVLHNPKTLIMKPKLRNQFRVLKEKHGEYIESLSCMNYKELCKYMEEL